MKYNPDNKYWTVLLALPHTQQLRNGTRQRVQLSGAKVTRIALTDIEQGLIGFQIQAD